jgi:hypothetical protein
MGEARRKECGEGLQASSRFGDGGTVDGRKLTKAEQILVSGYQLKGKEGS